MLMVLLTIVDFSPISEKEGDIAKMSQILAGYEVEWSVAGKHHNLRTHRLLGERIVFRRDGSSFKIDSSCNGEPMDNAFAS